jgi:hypothetical protein
MTYKLLARKVLESKKKNRKEIIEITLLANYN